VTYRGVLYPLLHVDKVLLVKLFLKVITEERLCHVVLYYCEKFRVFVNFQNFRILRGRYWWESWRDDLVRY